MDHGLLIIHTIILVVPATDYGYFREGDQLANKTLPELPKSASKCGYYVPCT